MIIPKEQRLGYEYRNYHHYAAIILELGTVGKILVTASILDLSNFNILHVLHPYNLNLRMEDMPRRLPPYSNLERPSNCMEYEIGNLF